MMSLNRRSIAVVTVARLCLPDDANVAGNVHGGTILHLMEEAGMITATRHMAAAAAADAYYMDSHSSTSGSGSGSAVGTLGSI
jgi:acyl-CoA hydrolase